MNESRESKNAEQLEELALDRGDTRRTRTERTAYRGTEDAAQRISDLEREIKPVSYTHLAFSFPFL